jgi:(2Fe-2S) ferredoxin
MTPSVAVDLSPPSLAALAIGGVLVLGHSWESIEASRGWKDAKRAKDASKNARPAENAAPATTTTPSLDATANKANKTNTMNQKIMTRAEREAAEAEARASRVLAIAAARAESEMKDLVSANRTGTGDESRERLKPRTSPVKIEVCTNNACAKRGGKELLRALEAMAEGNADGVKVEARRSRCMDACALACVVRVNGAGGLQRHAHVGADEAKEIFELATGVSVSTPGE